VETVERAQELCHNTVLGAIGGSQARAAVALNTTLGYCEGLVDRYIVEENCGNDQRDSASTSTCVQRVGVISEKLTSGLRIKTARQISWSKKLLTDTLNNLNKSIFLLTYLRNSKQWTEKSLSSNLELAQQTALSALRNLQAQADRYSVKPDLMLLRCIKASTNVLSSIADQMVKVGSGNLPTVCQNSLENTATYLNQWNESFSAAGSLSEVKTEVIAEAKEKYGQVEEVLLEMVDRMADWAPLSWAAIEMNDMNLDDEPMLEMEREIRGVEGDMAHFHQSCNGLPCNGLA